MLTPKRHASWPGFTLIEALVALAILASLMSLGAPSLASFVRNQQIRGSLQDLQSGLTLARTEAMRRNARVSLWLVDQISASCALSANGAAWVVSRDNPAGACNAAASSRQAPRLVQSRGRGENGSGVLVTAVDAGGAPANCVSFNGFGMPEATCGAGNPVARIDLAQSGARTLRLLIGAGGALQVCDPSITDTSNAAACP